jgi:uncharacterized protein YicC (UPF0701 family)
MATRDAAYAQNTTFDRMGALAKWIAAKAEEMTQLDRRIDRRLEHLQRSEENLRSLFEAIREQVTSAHHISEQLQKTTGDIEEHRCQVDKVLVDALANATRLSEAVEGKIAQLEQAGEMVVNATSQRLDGLLEQAKEAHAPLAAQIAQHVAQQSRFEEELSAPQIDFERRSAEVVESIRRCAVEQIERLSTQAAVAVDPVLARIDAQRERSLAQLNAAVDSAEEALRRRAQELCRTGDAMVDMLEQRLARRLENVRPKATESLDAAERAMQQHVTGLLQNARGRVSEVENELAERIAQMRPKLDQSLQSAQDDLTEQLARLEQHVFSMTGWLERRMGERIDALVAKTRESLSTPPAGPAAPLSAEALALACYADEYPAPAAPNSVDVQVYVDRKTDRPARSATIFR